MKQSQGLIRHLRSWRSVAAGILMTALLLTAFSGVSEAQVDQSDITLSQVIQDQPHLVFEGDSDDAYPQSVFYCGTIVGQIRYLTYVYVWGTSTSSWFSRLGGYSSHDWDYEPIIVRTDLASQTRSYIYDSGHYKAKISSTGTFAVDESAHYFRPNVSRSGDSLRFKSISLITPDVLQNMNNDLADIARLPFGLPLSLQWACAEPWKVDSQGYFSGPTSSAGVPIQLNALMGGFIGILAVLSFIAVTKGTTRSTLIIVGIGLLVASIAAGITGHWVAGQMSDFDGPSLFMIATGTMIGLAVGTAIVLPALRITSLPLRIGSWYLIAPATAAAITSAW